MLCSPFLKSLSENFFFYDLTFRFFVTFFLKESNGWIELVKSLVFVSFVKEIVGSRRGGTNTDKL